MDMAPQGTPVHFFSEQKYARNLGPDFVLKRKKGQKFWFFLVFRRWISERAVAIGSPTRPCWLGTRTTRDPKLKENRVVTFSSLPTMLDYC